MIANYHTHTYRCGHSGDYKDEDFVLAAIQSGFKILGFSDHTPWPYASSSRRPSVRMDMEELTDYITSVRSLQKKYKAKIKIYLGLECEYYPDYLAWLKETANRVDYLILASHWSQSDEYRGVYYGRATQAEDVDEYFRHTIAGMETGLFAYVAHPDLVLSDYNTFDKHCIDGSYALCRKAKELNLPLEYNLLGIEKIANGRPKGLGFPYPAFWEIAKECGCTAIIGNDAHHPHQLLDLDTIAKAEAYLENLGIPVAQVLPGLGY